MNLLYSLYSIINFRFRIFSFINRYILFHTACRYHAGGPMSVRGFSGYGIGPRSPSPTVLTSSSLKIDDRNNHGDSMGGFAKSTFLGTLSVPLDLKVRKKNI